VEARPPRTLTILGAGDVLLHEDLWRQARGRSGYDFGPVFADVAREIAGADLAICHLETPLGRPDGPFTGYPLFTVPPQIAVTLRRTGFDSCSTASNHSLDGGERGVYRTLDVLDAAGVRHAGTYRGAAAHRHPTLLTVRGVTVAHLSYTYWFNGLRRPPGKDWIANVIDADAILDEARRARAAGAEIVVASLHWGTEYDHEANDEQIRLARRLLASGDVDLILGCHAHVVQPFERINGRWVVYGMGNQIASQGAAYPARREGVMPRFTFTEVGRGRWRVTRAEAIPTWIEYGPRVRVVNLRTAGDSLQAARARIRGYVRSRGATSVRV
jgi:poly-gamma-glutamate synthesis protein (capsule biosynthesis protein)